MEESPNNTLKPIVLKTSVGFIFYDYIEIIMCCADGNNTIVFTTLKESSVKILHRISYIEKKYQNEKFLRCHKSYMINLVYLEKLLVKTHQAQLKGGYTVPLSNDCWIKLRNLTETSI
ncbi:MAG: LytTR family transcriptional regulator [Spirochaetes bacterium]|nr:LytTR family transcriptional regulator [Spirochaetota bacterium]